MRATYRDRHYHWRCFHKEGALITKDDMLDVLLAASPGFTETWHAFRCEWADEADPPLYVALGDFARHIIRSLESKDDDRLRRIFDAIERLHVEGDPSVQNAATIGLLENLQNAGLHQSTTPEQFRPFLRPESTKLWDGLHSFWNRDPLALKE